MPWVYIFLHLFATISWVPRLKRVYYKTRYSNAHKLLIYFWYRQWWNLGILFYNKRLCFYKSCICIFHSLFGLIDVLYRRFFFFVQDLFHRCIMQVNLKKWSAGIRDQKHVMHKWNCTNHKSSLLLINCQPSTSFKSFSALASFLLFALCSIIVKSWNAWTDPIQIKYKYIYIYICLLDRIILFWFYCHAAGVTLNES